MPHWPAIDQEVKASDRWMLVNPFGQIILPFSHMSSTVPFNSKTQNHLIEKQLIVMMTNCHMSMIQAFLVPVWAE